MGLHLKLDEYILFAKGKNKLLLLAGRSCLARYQEHTCLLHLHWDINTHCKNLNSTLSDCKPSLHPISLNHLFEFLGLSTLLLVRKNYLR